MPWVCQFDKRAEKELLKLGRPDQERVLRYLKREVTKDPRAFGKALRHDFAGLWRYRVGNIRLMCQIKEGELIVLVVRVAHRKDVYD